MDQAAVDRLAVLRANYDAGQYRSKAKGCAGFGLRDGVYSGRFACGNTPGTPWGSVYCWDCDYRRIHYVSPEFRRLMAENGAA